VLIMALLIVAVVAGISIKFASDYQLGLTRAENRWHGQQARSYLQGVESLAISFLKEDDPAVDYYGEGWDTEVPYEIEGGWLSGALSDASSRLNLNSLNTPFVAEKPGNSHERYSEPQRRFIRLLQCIPETPLSLDEAVAVLEAIVDWMDPDDEDSGFGGAESFFYQSAEIPYQTANGPFVSFDELRLVRYMTPELMLWLSAYTTVLPGQEGTNVNTMPPLLLRTLNAAEQLEPLSEMDAQQLVDSLPEAGFYTDVSELSTAWDLVVGSGTLDTNGLTVKTNYFWLRTQVSLVNQERIMQSLLIRNGPDIRVMRRSDDY
jgi:general secretion pathway protein K